MHRKHDHHHRRRRRSKSGCRCYCCSCLIAVFGAVFLWILYLYLVMLYHHAFEVSPGPEQDAFSALRISSSSSSSSLHDDNDAEIAPQPTFNTIPVEWKQGPPPLSQVHCVGLRPDNLNNNSSSSSAWMFRSCEYHNLCIDLQLHQYFVVVDDDDQNDHDDKEEEDRSSNIGHHSWVALGPINPRWNVGHGSDRGWHKVRWRPSVWKRERSSVLLSSEYYQLPDNVTLLPFHSMAGHNIGHLAWDDLWAVFKLWRQFYSNTTTTLSAKHQDDLGSILLVRHQIEESLYANCDIRRNKRLQCRENFERFVPLLGLHPRTFSTTKQLQLLNNNNNNNNNNGNRTPPIRFVCARRALAGLGLLQDHGFRDHGWEDAAAPDATDRVVPHNLGAGRSFYDYAQLLQRHARSNPDHDPDPVTTITASTKAITATTKAKLPPWPPIITFSLRSSRDWMRRQNFTSQMVALQEQQRVRHPDNGGGDGEWQIQGLDLRTLSLSEQVQLAATTSIFVTTCGGGAVTATFLPRGATLIVFYDAAGGLDFASLSNNHQPARLDWDLLNYAAAAHLRVHWLPLNTMDDPDNQKLFVRLVQHEVAILRLLRESDDGDGDDEQQRT